MAGTCSSVRSCGASTDGYRSGHHVGSRHADRSGATGSSTAADYGRGELRSEYCAGAHVLAGSNTFGCPSASGNGSSSVCADAVDVEAPGTVHATPPLRLPWGIAMIDIPLDRIILTFLTISVRVT